MVIRATGDRRLPKDPFQVGDLRVEPSEDGTAKAVVEPIEAESAQEAFDHALATVTRFIEYLALLGYDAGFLPTGFGDVAGRNLDLSDNPISPDEPPPAFDCIGGIITNEGQEALGQLIDPDGSKRRSGFVVVHHVSPVITPGAERVEEILKLWQRNLPLPPRLQTAISILHDAACAREASNAVAQTHTALEVLLEEEPSKTAVDVALARKGSSQREIAVEKASLRDALAKLLTEHEIPGDLAHRMIEQAMNARATSQVDIALDYLTRHGVSVDRRGVKRWRTLRGGLVHAAAEAENATDSMNALRQAVASAVLSELRALAAAQGA